jgi:HD-GYP domain-containing protein (c-di-GMP phosphodiesterase class II)
MDYLNLQLLFLRAKNALPIPVYNRADREKIIIFINLYESVNGLAERGLGRPANQCRLLVADALSPFIELANRLEDPKDKEKFINLICQAVEAFHEPTAEHQARVAKACQIITRNLPEPFESKALALAARLHDFGKIGWPNWMFIVSKSEAQRLIPAHHFISLYFLEAIHFLRPAAEIVRTHHAYDGYPIGCRPEEMTLESQILSAADYLDAMLYPRGYQNGPLLSRHEALAKVAERSYDPAILRVISEHLDDF